MKYIIKEHNSEFSLRNEIMNISRESAIVFRS